MAGANFRINWGGQKFSDEIKRELGNRLAIASEMVRARLVQNISQPTRTLGPSAPGAFPHANTGGLRGSYFTDVDREELIGIIGSPLKRSRYLEDGTMNMEARPHIMVTLESMLPSIKEVMISKIDVKDVSIERT